MLMFLAFWKISIGSWKIQWTLFAVGRILLLWQPATLRRCHRLPKVGRGPFSFPLSLAETVLWSLSVSLFILLAQQQFPFQHWRCHFILLPLSVCTQHPWLSVSKFVPLPPNLFPCLPIHCPTGNSIIVPKQRLRLFQLLDFFSASTMSQCLKFLDVIRAVKINEKHKEITWC